MRADRTSPKLLAVVGTVKLNDPVTVIKLDGSFQNTKVTKLFSFDGLKRIEITQAAAGDVICLAGIEDITIGETIADQEHRLVIPPIAVDEPTVSMIFGVNTSPVAGRDGQYVTSRNLRDRLQKELLGNVSIRVEDTDTPEQLKVVGRGELQLSILIEMMRREGFELQVSRPITKGDRRRPHGAGGGPGHRRAGGFRASSSPRPARRGVPTKMNHAAGACGSVRIPARGLIGPPQFLTRPGAPAS